MCAQARLVCGGCGGKGACLRLRGEVGGSKAHAGHAVQGTPGVQSAEAAGAGAVAVLTRLRCALVRSLGSSDAAHVLPMLEGCSVQVLH